MRMFSFCCLLGFFYALGTSSQAAERVFTGRVVDGAGAPVQGAQVEWGFFSWESEKRQIAKTDASGNYRLSVEKLGADYRLGIFKEGMAPQWRDGLIPPLAEQTEAERFNFTLKPPVQLRGKVLDNVKRPIAGVTVIAQSASRGFYSSFSSPTPSYPFPGPARTGVTNEQGEFVIKDLPPVDDIVATKRRSNKAGDDQGHQFALSVKTLTGRMPRGVHSTAELAKITITRSYVSAEQKPGGLFRGRVVDADSKMPIQKFRIVRRHRPEMISVNDTMGQFELKGLTKGRPYQVFVYADGYAPAVLRKPAVEASQTQTYEYRLTPGENLKGRLVTEDGQAVSGATIVSGYAKGAHNANRFYWGSFQKVVDGQTQWTMVQRVTSDAGGRFLLCQTEQPSMLAILAPGHARRFVSVEEQQQLVDDGELTIKLQPESRIRLQVFKDGQPESGASVRFSQVDHWDKDFGELKTDAEGNLNLDQLNSGDYQVSIFQYSGNTGTTRLTRRISLEPGQTQSIKMERADGQWVLSGRTLPFALVNLSSSQPIPYPHIGTMADADGNYRIEGIQTGSYQLTSLNPSVLSGYHDHGTNAKLEISSDQTYDLVEQFQFGQAVK